MLAIAIYGDEYDPDLKDIIQTFLIETKTMAKVCFFDDPQNFITVPGSFDLYILDMDTKVDVLALGSEMMEIDDKAHFAFYSENVALAYDVTTIRADYFICANPFNKKIVYEILKEVKRKVRERSIIINTPEGERRVKVTDVNYINIVKRCLCYHLKDGTMFDGQTLRTSFEKAIYPLQENEIFVFINPSLLINVSEIKIMANDHLTFENDEVLYFPKKAYEDIRSKWLTYNKI